LYLVVGQLSLSKERRAKSIELFVLDSEHSTLSIFPCAFTLHSTHFAHTSLLLAHRSPLLESFDFRLKSDYILPFISRGTMIGQTISHYKILEKLGEGGMGIVYKAHDTELERDVALKFLPRDVSMSEEERTRFVHEAKAASALEHPNICTIHHVERTPDGQMFIVMGYYEGQSISKKVEKGRLDVDEAVSIAIQIAEGLQAAHEKGIVHRDIKSSNVIVSDKGQVRILDFGLARRKGLSKLTKTGTTIGTASYMSPEQAQGGSVDLRTDLWSLGVVLYEMVTGRLPFRGEHEAAILYSVVNEQPRPIEESVSSASPELIHIIGRALEKNPAERYKTAEDMLIDLRRLKKETSRTGFSPTRGTKKKIPFFRNKIIIAALTIILMIVAGYFVFMKKGVEVNPDYTLRSMNVPFNTVEGISITPDGKWIVFGAKDQNKRWDLWAVEATGGEPRRVTHDSSDRAIFPDISPDGKDIVYNRITKKSFPSDSYKEFYFGQVYDICRISFNGGISKKIGVGNQPSWSPDGKRIGYVLDPTELAAEPYQPSKRAKGKSGNGEFWTMNPDGSGNTLEFVDTTAAKSWSNVYYAWSPDGRSVAWSHRLVKNGGEYGEIIIHDRNSHMERVLVSTCTDATNLCWSYNDQIIYSKDVGEETCLWLVPAGGGSPVRLTKGLASTGHPRLSADGRTLVFRQTKNIGHLWLVKMDGSRERAEIKIPGEPGFICPSISPDGKYITVVIATLGGQYLQQVFIFKRDGTDMHQISTGPDATWWPTWSPDGKRIFYYARADTAESKSYKIYIANVPNIDAPSLIPRATGAGWADSVTLVLYEPGEGQRRYFLDGRPEQKLSEDSIWATIFGNGKYVLFSDGHQNALRVGRPDYWCKIEDWDGIGPKNAKALPVKDYMMSYDAFYCWKGSELFRMSFPDWKMIRVNVNIQDRDPGWSGLSTTRDGREMVYVSFESFNKIGVIENLFR